MDRKPLLADDPVKVFMEQARSKRMQQLVGRLPSFAIEPALPKNILRLLERLDHRHADR